MRPTRRWRSIRSSSRSPGQAKCASATARAACATPTCTPSTASGRCRCRSSSATRARAPSRRSGRASPASRWATPQCSPGATPAASAARACAAARGLAARRASTTARSTTARCDSAVVPIPASVPFEIACLIGCSVTTGVGAVTNTARVEPGASVVVIGCGGVGLSVVMGAALAGAHPIIAVDVEDAKLDQARDVGATHAVRGDGDVAAAVKAIVPGGADYAFEAIGLQRTIELMPDLICLGGVAVMVGMTPEDVRVSFSGFGMAAFGHRVVGSNYGSSVAPIDFPRIAALFEAGKLPIDRLITRRVALDEVNSAFDDMRARRGGRAVIVYG